MLSLQQAEDLAARTLAAIREPFDHRDIPRALADRERVWADLAGLREADGELGDGWVSLRAYAAANLRRTADLYGVAP